MKKINNIKRKHLITTVLFAVMLTSCNFLDVIPPEQATLGDATRTPEATLGFLYSCYSGVHNPIVYWGSVHGADEYAMPVEWNHAPHEVAFDLFTPQSWQEQRWNQLYDGIGQILQFLRELENAPDLTLVQREEWEAEAYFLLAHYHFEILRYYGPCPITDKLVSHDILPEEYAGRSHYDMVTNWIVDILDEKVLKGYRLPMTRDVNDRGRATHVIALSLKARALLYAASPLWNGSFPYPSWQNKVESSYKGVDYGKELVSRTYDSKKWERARIACEEALQEALSAGHRLYGEGPTDLNFYTQEGVSLNNVYIPGGASDDFKKRVLLFRYMTSTHVGEGNTEIIWGLNADDQMLNAQMPHRLLQTNNSEWVEGWQGLSPFLNSIERFYMNDGARLDKNRTDLLERAGVDAGRPDLINLVVGREPRFYAWMAFDQGDWGTMVANGSPLQIELKDKEKQGYWPDRYARNYCVTGFLSQKWIRPNFTFNTSGNNNQKKYPRPLIRMAELYLNLAECYAMEGNTAKALENLNKVHQRAGLRAVTESDLIADYPLMEWIRNERFVELWGEGHRHFDIRRWGMGMEYLSSGKREGLNAEKIVAPTFEEFNTRVVVDQPYKWSDRMYIAPIFYSEIGKNRQLVQAPGY